MNAVHHLQCNTRLVLWSPNCGKAFWSDTHCLNFCFLIVLRSGDESYTQSTTHEDGHSPQSGKRRTAHRGGKYVVKVIVGESSVHQNWLVFVLIRRGDQSVRTRTAGVMVPVELHGGMTQGKCETERDEKGWENGWKYNGRESANLQLPLFLLCHLRYLLIGIQVWQILDTGKRNIKKLLLVQWQEHNAIKSYQR